VEEKIMKPAPIILFAYNRPWHTLQTLQSLKKNALAEESILFIYIDGPKKDASEEQKKKIEEVRQVCEQEKWCKEVHIIRSPENKGLSASVLSGVTEIVNRYKKVIVLEDDLVSDIYFLKFMNDTLDMYENDETVVSVTGYIYPVPEKLPEAFFLKGADCWGWATWKRSWDLLEINGQKLLADLREKQLAEDFDFYNTYPYTSMLEDQVQGKNNSWAILWYASAYLKNKFTLYPGFSLIQNIGNDSSGTHSHSTDKFRVKFESRPVEIKKQDVREDISAKKKISHFFNSLREEKKQGFLEELKSRFRRIMNG
jgi:hypothetical protein